ncbi:MAG: hypothetical protein ABII68_05900 [Pseudomonadota bacterium]
MSFKTKGMLIAPLRIRAVPGTQQPVEDGSANPLRSFAAHLTAVLGLILTNKELKELE